MTRAPLRYLSSLVPVALLLAVSATGCYRHNYGSLPEPPEQPATYAQWNHHILFGLISVDADLDVEAICGGPPAHVSLWVGPIGMILGAITAGIYVPTTTAVWCRAGGGPAPGASAPGAGDSPSESP